MTHPSHLLKELEAKARKRFGQHFLAEPVHVERMVALAGVRDGDRVLEVGPGLGILTDALLARGAALTAIELDRDLVRWLRDRYPTVALVQGDAVTVALPPLPGTKVVANLPYNAGTRILLRLLVEGPPDTMVVMLQKEVAERIVAPPGDRDRGSLSLAVQARARARIAWDVPAGAFYPPPKVTSSVLHLVPHPPSARDWTAFDRIAQAAFKAPRKQLRNSLAQGLAAPAGPLLERAGIAPERRPATLTVDDIWALVEASVAT
jgi:16S rRNA (adenine1518-N6/adenine1519-N6)-dimethyltransferase